MITSDFGITFYPATPLVLAMLVIIYPNVNRELLSITSLVGLMIGLFNILSFFVMPGYTATFLLGLAALFILLNVLLIVNLVAAAAYFVYRVRLEERLLSSQDGLGDHYLNYMKRTGRFFLKLRLSKR